MGLTHWAINIIKTTAFPSYLQYIASMNTELYERFKVIRGFGLLLSAYYGGALRQKGKSPGPPALPEDNTRQTYLIQGVTIPSD
jgi:hypothetical protein